MNWSFVHSVWTLVWHPRKPTLGVQTLCIALLLLMMASPSRSAFADCPAAPLASPDDMAISFLAANGVQASSASLLPSSVKEGMLVYDDTANKLKVCNGTNWVDVGSGGGTDTLASLSCTTGQIAKYDGTAWACAADGGGGSGPQVAFTVVKTSTQSLGSGALIDWQEAITNEGAAFDLATDKFTAPEAGLYYFHASLLTNNDTSIGDFTIYRNGSISRLRSYATHGATSYKPSVAQGVLLLNAGDVIDVRSNSASQSLFGGNGTSVTTFTGYKLGGGGSDTLSGLSCATNEIPKWNGTTWACAADGGGSGGGAEVAFRVNRNGVNQTVTSSTAANMDWTTEVFDTNNNFDLSTDRFTPTVAGKYLVTASAYCSNSTVHCLIHIYKNGTASIGEDYRSDSDTVAAVTALVDMNGTTDYLQVIVQNGGGTTINGATWLTFFSGALLGGGGSDTLAGLSCSVGEVPEWNGSAWVCGTGSGGGAAADFGAYQTITQFGTDIVAPSAGMVLHSADQAGSFCHVQIFVNGVNVATDKGYNTSSIAQSVTAPVAAGDTYRLSNDADCTNVKAFFVPLTGGSGADTLAGLSCAANEIPKWDGTTWACAADGGGSGSSGTLFSAYPSSAQAVPHVTMTKALFASESFDAKGEFASSRFTATEAGKYLLTSTVAVDGSESGLREIWVQIWKNGTVLINGNRMSAGTLGNLYPTVTAIVDAAPGDFYEVLVYQGSVGAASQNLIPSRTFFSGAKLNGGGSSQWSDVTGGISYAAGRVGIGTPSPDASALLDMTSSAQGFLPPRMTTAQRDAIAAPAAGLMIFNATMNQYQFWNGSAWSGLGGGVPAGTIAAFALAACPTGWTEYVPARGRFLRGIDPSGSTTVDAAGIRAPGSLQEGSFVMNNAGSATDIRVFNLGSEGFAGLNYDNAATSAPGFSGRWIQATGSPYVTNGSWGANTIDNNYVRVTRPKNVAVLFCQYSGGGGGGGGTAVAAGDAGQIQFNDGSDAFAADAALHWDNTNKRLGIGTTSPATSLHVNGTPIVNSGSTAPGLHVVPTSGSSYVFGANTAIGGAGLYDTTGGAWRLMVKDTTGNVGIGTTTPSQSLHLSKTTGDTYVRAHTDSNTHASGLQLTTGTMANYGSIVAHRSPDNGLLLLNSENGPVILGTNEIERMRVADNGNVGIGTASPVTPLHIGTSAGTGEGLRISNGVSGEGGQITLMDGTGAGGWEIDNSGTGASAMFRLFRDKGVNNVTAMTVSPAGNVGIGTTTPVKSLHIKGIEAGLFLEETTGGSDNEAYLVHHQNVLQIQNRTSAGGSAVVPYYFDIRAPAATISASNAGNVGIGTASPQSKLHLVGLASGSTAGGIRIEDNAGHYRILYMSSNNSTLGFYGSGGNIAYLTDAGVWTNASDVSIKKDIKPISYGLETVMKLNPVHYKMKSSDIPQIGFIAQEVRPLMPELVDGIDGSMTLSYGNMTAVLAKALQELKADNDNLRDGLNAANENYEELRREIDALKAAR